MARILWWDRLKDMVARPSDCNHEPDSLLTFYSHDGKRKDSYRCIHCGYIVHADGTVEK